MSAGFHGNNGLDPSTSIHILKTYVIPTITVEYSDRRKMLYMNVSISNEFALLLELNQR
jgi:hypothetical protein